MQSSWDPSAPASDGGSGGWLTSGTSSGTDSGFRTNSYVGGGTYSSYTRGGASGGGTSSRSATGTITEDRADESFWSSERTMERPVGGDWALISGSGTSSGSGHASFKLESDGTYCRSLNTPAFSYTVSGTTSALRESYDRHDYTSYSEVIDGEWKLVSEPSWASGSATSSGSASGFQHNKTVSVPRNAACGAW